MYLESWLIHTDVSFPPCWKIEMPWHPPPFWTKTSRYFNHEKWMHSAELLKNTCDMCVWGVAIDCQPLNKRVCPAPFSTTPKCGGWGWISGFRFHFISLWTKWKVKQLYRLQAHQKHQTHKIVQHTSTYPKKSLTSLPFWWRGPGIKKATHHSNLSKTTL